MKKIKLYSKVYGEKILKMDNKDFSYIRENYPLSKFCMKTAGGPQRDKIVPYINGYDGKKYIHILVHRIISDRIEELRNKNISFINKDTMDCRRKNLCSTITRPKK